jgi:hypothetical protein
VSLQCRALVESGIWRREWVIESVEPNSVQMPVLWAATLHNLGIALAALGEPESGTGRLEEAREAIGSSWDVYREAGMDRYDHWFETRLRAIDDLIASRRSGS